MLKDRQKSEFDGFLDCIIIKSCTIQSPTRRRSLESDFEKSSSGGWSAAALVNAAQIPLIFPIRSGRSAERARESAPLSVLQIFRSVVDDP